MRKNAAYIILGLGLVMVYANRNEKAPTEGEIAAGSNVSLKAVGFLLSAGALAYIALKK